MAEAASNLFDYLHKLDKYAIENGLGAIAVALIPNNAIGLDFKEVVEDLSGEDYTSFFDQWYFGEGYPTYNVEWSQNDGGMFMQVTQTTSEPSVTTLFTNLLTVLHVSFIKNDATCHS